MKAIIPILLSILIFFGSCQKPNTIKKEEFEVLMQKLAKAWSQQDTEASVNCFNRDAVYMQPPNEQYYEGHEQLKAYFGALKPGTTMKFHHLWFDENAQMGAGEFTFGNNHTKKGVTGVVVVTIKNKRIQEWREYFISGPMDFEKFKSTQNKKWKWHIGNYP